MGQCLAIRPAEPVRCVEFRLCTPMRMKRSLSSRIVSDIGKQRWCPDTELSPLSQAALLAGEWWKHLGFLTDRQIYQILSFTQPFLVDFADRWSKGELYYGYEYICLDERWAAATSEGWPASDLRGWWDFEESKTVHVPCELPVTVIQGNLRNLVLRWQLKKSRALSHEKDYTPQPDSLENLERGS